MLVCDRVVEAVSFPTVYIERGSKKHMRPPLVKKMLVIKQLVVYKFLWG
tara:strand:- start:1604 stop:1750 length:147 start_codon:yes stop_codon:yes gene_type:complete